MSPPDPKHALDPFDDAFPGVDALPDDVTLTDDLCLLVESLRLDDRPLPATLAARVAARVAERPDLQRAVADFARQHATLGEAPAFRASDDFAERVLAARAAGAAASASSAGSADETARPADSGAATGRPRLVARPVLRRLAAAAALLLAVSLGWDLAHPVDTLADPDTARGRWIVDELQPDPFGPTQIDAALREALPGPLDRDAAAAGADAHGATSAPAPADAAAPHDHDTAPPTTDEPPR